MDAYENADNTVTASFELPGLKKEDVKIDVQPGRLTVSGECTGSSEGAKDSYAIRERRLGRFSRTIPLPKVIKVQDNQLLCKDK
jgi:HSP20 family protein